VVVRHGWEWITRSAYDFVVTTARYVLITTIL